MRKVEGARLGLFHLSQRVVRVPWELGEGLWGSMSHWGTPRTSPRLPSQQALLQA